MTTEAMSGDPAGVYGIDDSGRARLVHEFTEEDYGLADVPDRFGLGCLEEAEGGGAVIVLDEGEIRQLKVMADAESFDHPEDFIQMCLDIHRFASSLGRGPHRFRES